MKRLRWLAPIALIVSPIVSLHLYAHRSWREVLAYILATFALIAFASALAISVDWAARSE